MKRFATTILVTICIFIPSALADIPSPEKVPEIIEKQFIFEDKELLDKLYEGLAINGVQNDTIVEGYYLASDNTTNNRFAAFVRRADEMHIAILTDNGVQDPDSKVERRDIYFSDFTDFNKKKSYGISQRHGETGNWIYYVVVFDSDGNAEFEYQITKEDAKRAMAIIDVPSKSTGGKVSKFVTFHKEMQEKYSGGTPYQSWIRGTIEKGRSKTFDEEYIDMLFTGFVKNGEKIIDDFRCDYDITAFDSGSFTVYREYDNTWLTIMAYEGKYGGSINEPNARIRRVLLYNTSGVTDGIYMTIEEIYGDYGLCQEYEYNKAGNRTVKNFLLTGSAVVSAENKTVELDSEDFDKCLFVFETTPEEERREIFDEMFEEMNQKYTPSL